MAICLVTMGNNAIKTKITPQRANKPANMKQQRPITYQCIRCALYEYCVEEYGITSTCMACEDFEQVQDEPADHQQ